jgi:hypothetical protein
MNFLNWKDRDKYTSALGIAAINPSFDRALALARRTASEAGSEKEAFWFSAHVEWAGAPIIRKTTMYRMWEGFWVVPLVESTAVKPGTRLNIGLVAFNMTERPVQRTIQVTGAEVPLEMQGNLTFTLPPWQWTVQGISIPATGAPGAYSVGFVTLTGEDIAATALTVGLLSLGTVWYAPGSAGFYLGYSILAPEIAQKVTEWEESAVRSAAERFETERAIAIAGPAGNRIPMDSVLDEYRAYLTPSRVLSALLDTERGPEAALREQFDDFILNAYGVRGAEKAFRGP